VRFFQDLVELGQKAMRAFEDSFLNTNADRGPSLPLELARRGWIPYRFPNSNIVVFLPREIAAAHDPEGVLQGSTNGREVEFSATLNAVFEDEPTQALEFVSHLGRKRGLRVRTAGTYRYFLDPAGTDLTERTMRFAVIGIPGYVVVTSILCEGMVPVAPALAEVRDATPHFIGELL
jgi:hypothetical protein